MPDLSYHLEEDQKNTIKLRELISELPSYTRDFFRGIESQTSSKTRIAYAYDLKVFYHYLHENNSAFGKKEIREISLKDLEVLKPVDIEEFLEYVKVYQPKNQMTHANQQTAIKRKLSSLRSFYKYFYMKEMISYDPVALVAMPKLQEKAIIRMDNDEVADFLDTVEFGKNLTIKQQKAHEKTKIRDLAMMTLFLGTGIRVSECVGLNIKDVDFKNGCIYIHRKGGKEVNVYFGEEVESALLDYMEERQNMEAASGHEAALFLSSFHRRITVRAVENLVKKYTHPLGLSKNITPHKLRSTYGTNLYKETGDIYLVADVLGHSDVNTTRKHYAAIEDEKRRSARDKVHLRRD